RPRQGAFPQSREIGRARPWPRGAGLGPAAGRRPLAAEGRVQARDRGRGEARADCRDAMHAGRPAQRPVILTEGLIMASDTELRAQAADNTLAANPLIGVRQEDIVESAGMLLQRIMANPGLAATQYTAFLGELGRIASGSSDLAPDARDKRFADAAWKDAPAYRALAQSYLAWSGALNRFVDQAEMEDRDRLRARFIVSLFVDAFAPTNTIHGNPAALRKLVDTGGASLPPGLEHFSRRLPS